MPQPSHISAPRQPLAHSHTHTQKTIPGGTHTDIHNFTHTSSNACNSACKSSVLECPTACFCVVSDSTDKTANLSLAMPVEDLARLMSEIDHQKRNDKGERVALPDVERERLTSLTQAPAPSV